MSIFDRLKPNSGWKAEGERQEVEARQQREKERGEEIREQEIIDEFNRLVENLRLLYSKDPEAVEFRESDCRDKSDVYDSEDDNDRYDGQDFADDEIDLAWVRLRELYNFSQADLLTPEKYPRRREFVDLLSRKLTDQEKEWFKRFLEDQKKIGL